VTNWAAYDIALRQRGSLTVWFTEAAIAAWKAEPRATRGGQPRYSALAITTALTLRAVFRLAPCSSAGSAHQDPGRQARAMDEYSRCDYEMSGRIQPQSSACNPPAY